MKYIKCFQKIILLIVFCGIFFLCVNGQSKIAERKLFKLKHLNVQSKLQLVNRLRLYAEYIKNNEQENLFKLLINNFESKMSLGFITLLIDKNTQTEEFREKFLSHQDQFNRRVGKITDYKIRHISWKSEFKGNSEKHDEDDSLLISINFRTLCERKICKKKYHWDSGYWFYAFNDENEWYFTPLNWIDI